MVQLAIPAANAYGLMLLIILMGYGLVEIPRGLWFNANTRWVLKHLELKAPALKEACVDAESEIYEVARILGHASTKIQPDDELRPILDKLLEKCPLALNQRNMAEEEEGLPPTFTKSSLVVLNTRLKRALFLNDRETAKLKTLQLQAFRCEDIIENYTRSDRRFKSLFFPVKDDKYKDEKLQFCWWWYTWIKPILMRTLCVICIIASVLIVWSESTFQFTSVELSIPQLLLAPGNFSYGTLELIAVMFICYICCCVYWTLLNLNIFGYYEMVPNHHTDEISLLFVGAYLCKLTFPICYNFLNMGGLAEGKVGSNGETDYSSSPVFIQYLGPAVNLTPLFGTGYNDWVPRLVVAVCFVIAFNLHGRIMKFLRIETFMYEKIGMDSNETEEGRSIIHQGNS